MNKGTAKKSAKKRIPLTIKPRKKAARKKKVSRRKKKLA